MRYMGGLSDLLMTRVLLQENICVSCGTVRSICVWWMRICHLKYNQHSAFVTVCLQLSELAHSGISGELLSRLLPHCFCQLIQPNTHLIEGRGCEGLCYAFLLASDLWLFERSRVLEAVLDWSDHAISHGALFTQSLSFLFPSWRSVLWKGNNSWRKLGFFARMLSFSTGI